MKATESKRHRLAYENERLCGRSASKPSRERGRRARGEAAGVAISKR